MWRRGELPRKQVNPPLVQKIKEEEELKVAEAFEEQYRGVFLLSDVYRLMLFHKDLKFNNIIINEQMYWELPDPRVKVFFTAPLYNHNGRRSVITSRSTLIQVASRLDMCPDPVADTHKFLKGSEELIICYLEYKFGK